MTDEMMSLRALLESAGAPFGWFVFEPGARNGPIELQRISWRELNDHR
jgi:hypothetical protein